MHERRDGLAVVVEPGHRAARVGCRQLDRSAPGVDEGVSARKRKRELQRRVTERAGECVAEARDGHALELEQQVRDGRACELGAE